MCDAAKGELETTVLALFCLGFLTSLLLRRCFWDMGDSFTPGVPERGRSAVLATLGAFHLLSDLMSGSCFAMSTHGVGGIERRCVAGGC